LQRPLSHFVTTSACSSRDDRHTLSSSWTTARALRRLRKSSARAGWVFWGLRRAISSLMPAGLCTGHRLASVPGPRPLVSRDYTMILVLVQATKPFELDPQPACSNTRQSRAVHVWGKLVGVLGLIVHGGAFTPCLHLNSAPTRWRSPDQALVPSP
jgi:hypothetical protein